MARPIKHRLIERLYARANAGRWQVSIGHFARALESSAAKAFAGETPSARDLQRYLESLRLDELALACACTEGHAAAWDHFVAEYRPVLYRAADAMDPGGGARELADSLYADLFQSLFRYYHGRSSLATWLRAVLAQRLVDRARAATRTVPLPDLEPPAAAQHEPDPDRPRHLRLIHTALRDAVDRLGERDRLRLRYYYSQGLTLAEVGRLLREHEASVSRRLSAARKAIRRDVERQLQEAGLGPDEVARCFESVREDAGPLDLDSLLADGATARNPEPTVQSTEALAGGRMKR
jgi:RNA polymerase sigma factor (sigma-70 family)